MSSRSRSAPSSTDLEHWLGRPRADVATECDTIRATRPLTDDILFRLLGDMAAIVPRVKRMSEHHLTHTLQLDLDDVDDIRRDRRVA